MLNDYEHLRELVEATADDVRKASGGNKAAGTRVRKAMQEIKEAAQLVRKRVLEVRSQDPA
ncbi:MAG: histone H1 [Phycisphaerae bacterium]